jgi:hypothetical protein
VDDEPVAGGVEVVVTVPDPEFISAVLGGVGVEVVTPGLELMLLDEKLWRLGTIITPEKFTDADPNKRITCPATLHS